MGKNNAGRNARFVHRWAIPLECARDRNVLHVGVGGAADNEELARRFRASDLRQSLHGRLFRVAKSLTGLDVNAETIAAMREKVPGRYVVADIGAADLCNVMAERFEAILFLEVIQDLANPGSALANLRNLLTSDGVLIISTCNAYCLGRFAKMFFKYESVSPEHICYFSYLTLKRLLYLTGFEIENVDYTFLPRSDYQPLPMRIFFALEKLLCKIWPQFGEGIIVTARPRRDRVRRTILADQSVGRA